MGQPDRVKKGILQRILDRVEVVGNRLPQPVTLFALLIGVVLLLSWAFDGHSVLRPGTGVQGRPAEYIEVFNLLSGQGLQQIFTRMVDAFAHFPPLGLVLVVMLGLGVAERSGLIAVALRVLVSKVPRSLMTFTIVVAGMLSSIAADAGYVVLIPLGAAIFAGMGRHPLAGLAAAFAGVSGGFGANLIPTSLDPMIAAFTEPAARIIDPTYTVNPLSNFFFLAASVPIVGLAGTWVTERIVAPRLGAYTPIEGALPEANTISALERRGLSWAMGAVLVMLALVALTIIPANGILRDASGQLLPFYRALVPIMFILFFVAGLVYGVATRSIRSDKDVARMTADSMGTMGGYIVLAFVASQFVAYFNWSNLGLVVAVNGAQGLQAIGFEGMPLLVAFILVTSGVNILIGSASAKWAIMAPIFVPMLMLMGYSPETTQAAYRIGDSYSNILTPLLPYFPLIITFAQRYVKGIGIGTIISLMLPYAIAFMLVRIPMFMAWVWLEIPLGIEGPIYFLP